jgi:hypothetical protein
VRRRGRRIFIEESSVGCGQSSARKRIRPVLVGLF